MNVRTSASLILTLFALCATRTIAQRPQTVLQGVYTEAQADRGDMQFHANCAKCHEGADVDGPPLEGDPFIERWREDSLTALFNFIKTKMPQDSPGKLSDSVYRDILSYCLNRTTIHQENRVIRRVSRRHAAGRKAGPMPLPEFVGARCGLPFGRNAWSL